MVIQMKQKVIFLEAQSLRSECRMCVKSEYIKQNKLYKRNRNSVKNGYQKMWRHLDAQCDAVGLISHLDLSCR